MPKNKRRSKKPSNSTHSQPIISPSTRSSASGTNSWNTFLGIFYLSMLAGAAFANAQNAQARVFRDKTNNVPDSSELNSPPKDLDSEGNNKLHHIIHYAKTWSHDDVGTTIVYHHELINEKNHAGQTALHLACGDGKENFIAALLEQGADVNAVDNEGNTPLQYLFERYLTNRGGFYESIKHLLNKGANPNVRDSSNLIPLFSAASLGDVGTLKLLLQHKADINVQDNEGDTPLMLAVQAGHEKAVAYLLQCEADIRIKNFKDVDALAASLFQPNVKILELLIQHGANIEMTYSSGKKPIHLATLSQVPNQILETLLEKHADPNSLAFNGEVNPLILATIEENTAAVISLLNSEAVPFIKNRKNPIDFAKNKNTTAHKEIVAILTQHEKLHSLFEDEKYEEIRKLIDELPEDIRNRPYLQLIYSSSLFKENNFIGAARVLEKLAQTHNNPKIRHYLAENYVAVGQFSKALDSINDAVRLHPENDDYTKNQKVIEFYNSQALNFAVISQRKPHETINANYTSLPDGLCYPSKNNTNYDTVFRRGAGITHEQAGEYFRKFSQAKGLADQGNYSEAKKLYLEIVEPQDESTRFPHLLIYHKELSLIYAELAKTLSYSDANDEEKILKYYTLAYEYSLGKNPFAEAEYLKRLLNRHREKNLFLQGSSKLLNKMEEYLWIYQAYSRHNYLAACERALNMISPGLAELEAKELHLRAQENLYAIKAYSLLLNPMNNPEDLIEFSKKYLGLLTSIKKESSPNSKVKIIFHNNTLAVSRQLIQFFNKKNKKDISKIFSSIETELSDIADASIDSASDYCSKDLNPQERMWSFLISLPLTVVLYFAAYIYISRREVPKTSALDSNKTTKNKPKKTKPQTNIEQSTGAQIGTATASRGNTGNAAIYTPSEAVKAMWAQELQKIEQKEQNKEKEKAIAKETTVNNIILSRIKRATNANDTPPPPPWKFRKNRDDSFVNLASPKDNIIDTQLASTPSIKSPTETESKSTTEVEGGKNENNKNNFKEKITNNNTPKDDTQFVPIPPSIKNHTKTKSKPTPTKSNKIAPPSPPKVEINDEVARNKLRIALKYCNDILLLRMDDPPDSLKHSAEILCHIMSLILFCETMIQNYQNIKNYFPNRNFFESLRIIARHRWRKLLYANSHNVEEKALISLFLTETGAIIYKCNNIIKSLLAGTHPNAQDFNHHELFQAFPENIEIDIPLYKLIIQNLLGLLASFRNKNPELGNPDILTFTNGSFSALMCLGDLFKDLRDYYTPLFYVLIKRSDIKWGYSDHTYSETKSFKFKLDQSNNTLDDIALKIRKDFEYNRLLTTLRHSENWRSIINDLDEIDIILLSIEIRNALGHLKEEMDENFIILLKEIVSQIQQKIPQLLEKIDNDFLFYDSYLSMTTCLARAGAKDPKLIDEIAIKICNLAGLNFKAANQPNLFFNHASGKRRPDSEPKHNDDHCSGPSPASGRGQGKGT